MNRLHALPLTLVAGCATTKPLPPEAQSATVLASASTKADDYGALVYEGRVFSLAGPRETAPLFTYERRVRHLDDGVRSTSFTHDATRAVLVEVAEHGPDYALRSFTEYQFQTGELGRVLIHDGTVEFHLASGDSERVASEPVTLPVVVGPTLFGFVGQHWAELNRGETIPFRFAVVNRLETVGFELHTIEASPGQVRVQMRASSALIRLAVNPLVITYSTDGQLVSLDGRVPTKRQTSGGWVDFDAHVEYANHTPRFE